LERGLPEERVSILHKRLLTFIESGGIIIVEGKRDKHALIANGFSDEHILTVSTAPYKLVELLTHITRDVLILTDQDARGEQLYRTLRHDLLRHGVRVHSHLRNTFFATLRITHVEDLPLDTFTHNQTHPEG